MYNEVIERIKHLSNDILLSDDVHSWVLGGVPNFDMCFVRDECPKKYRDDILNIIKDVESQYIF
jgi:hypothetical protein